MARRRINFVLQLVARLLLGAALIFAGISHLTWSRIDFLAQVPPAVPIDAHLVVLLSGVLEILLGLGLIILHTAGLHRMDRCGLLCCCVPWKCRTVDVPPERIQSDIRSRKNDPFALGTTAMDLGFVV